MGSGASQVVEAPPYADGDPGRSPGAYVGKPYRIYPHGSRPVSFAKTGVASRPSESIVKLFRKSMEITRDNKILYVERPVPEIGEDGQIPPSLPLEEWKSWTATEVFEESRQLAKAYLKLGLDRKDTVSIYGFNSPEWCLGVYSCMCAGGISSGIYPTDSPDQLAYKLDHSKTAIVLVESQKHLDALENIKDEVPYLKAAIVWKANEVAKHGGINRKDGSIIKVLSWDEAKQIGSQYIEGDSKLDQIENDTDPTTCASLVYTSGTTGRPKAVMLSHDNIWFQLQGTVLESNSYLFPTNKVNRILSYLPLSHVAGLFLDILVPLLAPAVSANGSYNKVAFARCYDLKRSSIVERLKIIRPTLFLGVPRVWEKLAEKLQGVGAKTKGLKKVIATYAKKQNYRYHAAENYGCSRAKKTIGYRFSAEVMQAIRKKLGLDQMVVALTGAAPIKLETLEYFAQLGIHINEVYGMSECGGVTTWSTNQYHKWGTVGWACPGVEVKIFRVNKDGSNVECPKAKDIFHPTEEEEGEVCYRGRHIMLGYLANKSYGQDHIDEIEKKTKEAIDDEGWLHSGDKGSIAESGLVRITGRYKELIIGAGGENIAPVPIENDVIRNSEGLISNVMMVGDKRKYNVALITLAAKGATGEFPGGDELLNPFKTANGDIKKISEATKCGDVIKFLTDAISRTNGNGEIVTINAAKIQKFTILPCDFSITTGELTATLKTKRSEIEKKNTHIIDAMYNSSDKYVEYFKP